MAAMATEQSQGAQMEDKGVEGQSKVANGRAPSTEPTENEAGSGVNRDRDGSKENKDEKEESVPSVDDTKDVANQDAFSSNQAVSTNSGVEAEDGIEVETTPKDVDEKRADKGGNKEEETEKQKKEDTIMDEAKADAAASEESKGVETKDPETKDVEMEDVEKTADTEKPTDAGTKPEVSEPPQSASEVDAPPQSDDQSAAPIKTAEVNGTDKAAEPSTDDVLGDARISQLAIDKDGEPSQSIPASDVVMMDAPQASSSPSLKVARERDQDETEEPAAKRIRTETDGDDEKPPKSAADKPSTGAEALDKIPRWLDSHLDSLVINDSMRKAYRHYLALAKKTTSGMNFRDSVEKLWPALWENYTQLVHNPMDLGEVDRRMRDGKYTTVGQFRDDLSLIYLNCVTFNGADNLLVKQAEQTLTTLWGRILEVKTNEPSSKPAKPVPNRHESRSKNHPPPPVAPPPRRQSQSQTAVVSPTDASEPAYAVPPSGVPQIRRASTLSESNRPKRAIQAPKNKDIDYTKSSKKNVKPELQFCEEVLSELVAPKNALLNGPFLYPVDPVFLKIPTYFQIIKKPMDLSTIGNKLAGGQYQNIKQFDADVKLMVANCYKFNGVDAVVSHAAAGLEKIYKNQLENKNQWLATHVPKPSPTVPSNHGSDADSDDEADAAPQPQSVTNATNATIETLQTKMKEEMNKLTELFNEANPNQALISLQQSVVQTVQAALLQEKQRAATQVPAPKASAKAKAGKPAKPKPSSGSSKRASTGAPKRSAPASAKKKRRLTDDERALIPEAIGRLQEPEVNLAIDWIKKDTGQAENGDGEIELDMDQISPDCLLRLFNLCKKAGTLTDPAADPPVESSPPTQSAKPARPKGKTKNKPMSASEQDRKIEELRAVEARFKGNPAPHPSAQGAEQQVAPVNESSSEDESSEEE